MDEELERELDRVRDLMEKVEDSLETYKTILKPYWYEKGELENAIRRTHFRDSCHGLIFNPAGAGDRKPYFDGLLALAIEWGTTVNEQRQLKSMLSGYVREVTKIKTELKRMLRKGSPNEDQGRLL